MSPAAFRYWLYGAAFALATSAFAAEFGSKGGPEPKNIERFSEELRESPYDLELLISYGTSKGGSAGHLALNIRNENTNEETVYSANFYADRAEKHAEGYYDADLMLNIPNKILCSSSDPHILFFNICALFKIISLNKVTSITT